jgi:hypothetical protein
MLDIRGRACYTNAIDLDRFSAGPAGRAGTKGKTVQIRCGAAAVIGQATEPSRATAEERMKDEE